MSASGLVPPELSVAIVGGGLIGLSVAWRLAQKNRNVHVLEKSAVGREASWAGAGMLAPGGEFDTSSPLAELAIAARRQYHSFVQELENESSTTIDFQECGALDLAFSQEELQTLNKRASQQSRLGIVSKELLPVQVHTFWPHIARSNLVGARFYPDDAIVNPRDVVNALRDACSRRSVDIREQCQIERICVEENGVCVESKAYGSARYKAVVLAAGAWSNQFAITGVPDLPQAEPVKGQLIGYHQPEQTCNTIVRHNEYYFLQRATGMLVAGASVERAGFDRQISPVTTERLAQQAGLVFPHLSETTPSDTWIGFRPGAQELQLGLWHSSRLYLAYGHYRNGILLAPISGEMIANEINANWEKL